MDVHPPKNGINRYWSIAIYRKLMLTNPQTKKKHVFFLGTDGVSISPWLMFFWLMGGFSRHFYRDSWALIQCSKGVVRQLNQGRVEICKPTLWIQMLSMRDAKLCELLAGWGIRSQCGWEQDEDIRSWSKDGLVEPFGGWDLRTTLCQVQILWFFLFKEFENK